MDTNQQDPNNDKFPSDLSSLLANLPNLLNIDISNIPEKNHEISNDSPISPIERRDSITHNSFDSLRQSYNLLSSSSVDSTITAVDSNETIPLIQSNNIVLTNMTTKIFSSLERQITELQQKLEQLIILKRFYYDNYQMIENILKFSINQ